MMMQIFRNNLCENALKTLTFLSWVFTDVFHGIEKNIKMWYSAIHKEKSQLGGTGIVIVSGKMPT